ncbi:MAG: exodeoxyribonuclease VII large subunit [Ruminococcaceae bacterium]|nr:exodeoxyribonuclease VII large subunit [Oscillospiraceae bacterium]
MNVLTVSQVNTYIKAILDEIPHVKNIYICGEISNFKHYPSGHMYFTLKDAKSQLKCIMFSSDNYKLKFAPENGMKVICFGQIGVYERDGVYQLYVRDMQVEGIGSLTIAFEQLKAKLESEGLFSEDNKKPIPKYPNKIGVATSNRGAAVEDIKNIISRRYPLCEIIIVPTVVQGDSAPADIVKSVEFLDNLGDIDTIIVGRGGGSIEDLWAFNTEEVARAVFKCKTPIISAVGHETDFTICDFVADLRAPTPSAAAELSVPDIVNEKLMIQSLSYSLDVNISRIIEKKEENLNNIKNNSALADFNAFYESLENNIQNTEEKLRVSFKNNVLEKENSLKGVAYSLNALSPLAVLSRGYSITKNQNSVVKSISQIKANDEIRIILSDGEAKANVSEVLNNE